MNQSTKRPNARGHRSDGIETRSLIIEKAGALFAQYGFNAVASKEICQAAGVTSAAVNYHFQSKEGLYQEVLTVAEQAISASGSLEQLTRQDLTAKAALSEYLYCRFYDAITNSGAWPHQLLLREAFMPSDVAEHFETSVVRPRFILLQQVMAAVLGRAPEDPKVQEALLACVTLASPWSIKPSLLERLTPAIYQCSAEEQATRLTNFCLAGIDTYINSSTRN